MKRSEKKGRLAGVAARKLLSEPPFHYLQHGDGGSILHVSWRCNDFVHIQYAQNTWGQRWGFLSFSEHLDQFWGWGQITERLSPHHILEGVSENKSLPKVLKVGWCLLGHPNRLPSRPRVYIPICKGLGHGLTEPKIVLCLTLMLTPRPRASLVAMGPGDGQAYTTMVSGLLGHLLSLRCSGHFLYHFNMFIYLSFFRFFFFFGCTAQHLGS